MARENALDRINPVTRLGLTILLSVPVLVTLDPVSAAVILVGQLVIFVACGYSASSLARKSVPLFVMAPIAALTMLFYGAAGGHVYWAWGPITISDNSLWLALAIAIRVLALGMTAIVLIGGADATRMADGLAQVAHFPARFVLGTLAGVRLASQFAQDWRTLELARRARGLGDTGRFKRFFTMAFALLVIAIRRGTKLSTAMEARGFGSDAPRTWARESRVGVPDAIALVATVALCASALVIAQVTGTLHMVGS